MTTNPSRPSRSFDVAKSVHLLLVDTTPKRRLSAFQLLISTVADALGVDGEASMDRGHIEVNEEMGGKMYTVEFGIVFPVATLAAPEVNEVLLKTRVVRMPPKGGIDPADLARASATRRMKNAVGAAVAPGKPLAGRIQIAP